MKQHDTIVLLSIEVMGSEAALKWLDTPHNALEGRKPFDILDTPAGAYNIERLLFKMKDKRRW